MIPFETLHWKWWIRSDNIVMERGTVLNISVFAAIFLSSCFSEIGGFPLDSSKIYWRCSHVTGRMSRLGAVLDGRENLITLKEPHFKGLPHKLLESYESDQEKVAKPDQNTKEKDLNEFLDKNLNRIRKREINEPEIDPFKPVIGQFNLEPDFINNNEVSDGIVVYGIMPDKKYSSDENNYRMNDAPENAMSNFPEVSEGIIIQPFKNTEEDTGTDEDNDAEGQYGIMPDKKYSSDENNYRMNDAPENAMNNFPEVSEGTTIRPFKNTEEDTGTDEDNDAEGQYGIMPDKKDSLDENYYRMNDAPVNDVNNFLEVSEGTTIRPFKNTEEEEDR